MSIPASAVWECRTTGNSQNGGAFDPSVTSPGVDRSQTDAAFTSFADLVIGATTTQLTSAASPFTSADVGNTIQIASGVTGFTAGWYSVRSVASGVATMDRAVGTASSTGGVGKLGGAVDHPATIGGVVINNNTIWVRSGTYTCGATANVSGGRVNENSGARWYGYGTARGDLGTRPVLRCGAASVQIWNNNATSGMVLDNFEFQGNAQTSSRGFYGDNGGQATIVRCKFSGFNNYGAFCDFGTGYRFLQCEFVGCSTQPALSLVGSNGGLVESCTIRGNTATGLSLGANTAIGTASSGNTGSLSSGFTLANLGVAIRCTAHGNGSHGFDVSGTAASVAFLGCVSYGNGGWGFTNSSGILTYPRMIGCAAGGNASGGVNAAFFLPASIEGGIALTADPFTNAAGLDFSPNNTAGGGALIRGVARTLPGLAGTSYPDVGAYQSQPTTTVTGGFLPLSGGGVVR